MNISCRSCKKEIDDSLSFCSYCGQKTNIKGLGLTTAQKTRIYLASFFLSPLGLIWFFKFFRDDNLENRKVGYISLVITLVPLVLVLVIGGTLSNYLFGYIEKYEKDLGVYSELGL